MVSENLENVFLRILKRIMLLVIGSGLLGNALYIYGLGYYQGYVEAFGFEYNLFPIEWKDTLLWTYAASRELGVTSIELMSEINSFALFIIVISVYFIARIWMQLSNIRPSNSRSKAIGRFKFKLAKKVYALKTNHKFIYKFVYKPFKWFLLKEKSFVAFVASYFFMVFIIFLPLFIIIWIYFPMFGINHGNLVAKKRVEYYDEYLCGDSSNYWSQCIEINLHELKSYQGLNNPIGRVLFKNGSIIGLLTKEGPITLSFPNNYYYKPDKNPCYNNGCITIKSDVKIK